MSTEASVASPERTDKQEDNVLIDDFEALGFPMDRLFLTGDEVDKATELFSQYQTGDSDWNTTKAPQPLTVDQQTIFLEYFVEKLLHRIGLPNATCEYTANGESFLKKWMPFVSGWSNRAFCNNFSFRDSQGGSYIVEVAFVPKIGFKANIRSIPNTREGSGSTPLVTQGSPAASAPGSGA